MPGWWLGSGDGRPTEPYIAADRWDEELRAAGFSGIESAIYDNEIPYQINVNIVSRPAETLTYPKTVTILSDPEMNDISQMVQTLFIAKGFRVEISTIDQTPSANQDIISVLDLTAPFFDDLSPEKLESFQRYIGNLKSSGILWLTKPCQVGCEDPRYSQILGMARTVRSELLVDFATFEIDKVDGDAIEAVFGVFSKFQRRAKGPELDPDWEFALVEGVIQIPRYHWLSTPQQPPSSMEIDLPRRLEIGKYGSLKSLRWVEGKMITLVDDQVEIEPRAVGLNFKVPFSNS